MHKHIEPIVGVISELIEILKMKNAKIGELMLKKKNTSPGVEKMYSEKLARNQQQIIYLTDLQTKLEKSQTEQSMLEILDKVGNIEIRAIITNKSLKQALQKKRHEISIRVPLASYGKISQFIKVIRESREAILQLLREEKSNTTRVIVGVPDEKSGRVRSPGIDDFIEKTKTSNVEHINENQPPALNDFRRDDRVNGTKLPEESTKTAAALRDSLMKFLSESQSAVDDSSRLALCNAMLKNGQTLQTVFTNEMAQGRSSYVSQQNHPLTYSQGVATFNWYLNEDGKLSIDLTLDVKSVTDLSSSPTPLVLDRTSGELREIDPKNKFNPRGDDYKECPTLMTYKATITFDTEEIERPDKSTQNKEVMAVPSIAHYEVRVFSNQIHYTPTFSNYVQSEDSNKSSVYLDVGSHR